MSFSDLPEYAFTEHFIKISVVKPFKKYSTTYRKYSNKIIPFHILPGERFSCSQLRRNSRVDRELNLCDRG